MEKLKYVEAERARAHELMMMERRFQLSQMHAVAQAGPLMGGPPFLHPAGPNGPPHAYGIPAIDPNLR